MMNSFLRKVSIALILLISILTAAYPCQAASTEASSLKDLFSQLAHSEDNNLEQIAKDLSDAFHAEPVGFLNALAEEDMLLWDTVADLMADYHTTPEGNAPYTQTVLETFAHSDAISQNGRNILCAMLVSINVDLRNMGDGFHDALFAAKTDGAASTKATYIAVIAFLQSPSGFVRELAEEDQKIQDRFTFLMVFDWYDTSYEPEMRQTLEELLNTELPEAELAVVNAFNDQWAAVDAQRAEATAPAESEPAAETTDPSVSYSDETNKENKSVFDESEFKLVLEAVKQPSAIPSVSSAGITSVETSQQSYKIYSLIEPDFLEGLKSVPTISQLISNDYVWIVPLKSGEIVRVGKSDSQWSVIGYSTETSQTVSSSLIPADIDSALNATGSNQYTIIQYFEAPMYHTNFALVMMDSEEFLVPYGSRPDLTGLENGAIYSREEVLNQLATAFGEGQNGLENAGIPGSFPSGAQILLFCVLLASLAISVLSAIRYKQKRNQ